MEPPIVTSDNGKTAGIISYFTIVGWLIAYFGFHQNNKTSLGSYQLRQTLLLHIITMVLRYGLALILAGLWVTTGFFSLWGLFDLLYLIFFIIWIIGLIGAVQGEQKAMPIIGDMAQRMFPNI